MREALVCPAVASLDMRGRQECTGHYIHDSCTFRRRSAIACLILELSVRCNRRSWRPSWLTRCGRSASTLPRGGCRTPGTARRWRPWGGGGGRPWGAVAGRALPMPITCTPRCRTTCTRWLLQRMCSGLQHLFLLQQLRRPGGSGALQQQTMCWCMTDHLCHHLGLADPKSAMLARRRPLQRSSWSCAPARSAGISGQRQRSLLARRPPVRLLPAPWHHRGRCHVCAGWARWLYVASSHAHSK